MEEFMIDIEPKKENNEPESSFANTCEETAAPLADNENRENISPQSGEDLFGQQMRDEIPENFAVSDEAKDITAQIESLTSGLRKSGKTVTYTFELEGIGCPKSAEEIEQKVRGIIGVESAEINFNTTQLTVEVDRTMTAGLVRKINAAAKQTDRTIVLKPIGEAAELLMRRQPLRKEEDRYSFAKKTRLDSVLALLGNKDNQKLIFIMLCTAVLLAAIAVIFSKITVLSIICSVLAVLIAGYLPAVRAVKSIMQKRFDYNELAVFSAIASCCIGKFTASAVMLVAYRLYEYAEKWATSRSRKPLEEAKKAMTDEANLMVSADCSTEKVPSSSVSVGQMIVVFPNERIPLDGVVAEGEGTINSSDVTGETNLIDVKPGSAVLSGSRNGSVTLKIKVTSNFENSAATKIYSVLSNSSSEKSEREVFMEKLSKVFTPAVVTAGLLLTIIPVIFGGKFTDWFYRTLIFFVASGPASLAATMPLGFFTTMSVCAKNGVLIKNGKNVQLLAESNAVVFNKTGVLTRGELRVAQVRPVRGMSERQILTLAAIAESGCEHPIAQVIRKAAGNPAPPFDLSNKITQTGVKASFSGHTIIVGNAKMMSNFGVDISNVGSYTVYVALDGTAVGAIKIADIVRDDAAESVGILRNLGIEDIILITGDNVQSATEICALCGIESAEHSLDADGKANIVGKIASSCGITAYVGNGIDDTGAMKAADVGVAMGFETSDNQRDGDAIVTSNRVLSFAKSVCICTKALTVIKVNIVIALVMKALVLLLALIGVADLALAVVADLVIVALSVLNTARINRFAKDK